MAKASHPHSPRRITARGAVSAIALTMALASGGAAAQTTARGTGDTPLPFRIEAQPLATALLEFSEQSDIIVTVPSDLLDAKQAPPVSGNMSPAEALERLLAGSGLRYVRGSNGQVTIVGAAVQRGAYDGGRMRYARASKERRTVLARNDAGAAQTPAAAQASASEEGPTIEQIVVTARKRAETLQSVPFSVNALTESAMRDRGVQNLEDVARSIAGFTIQNLGPGQSQVAIRGVSAGQIVRDQPGVKEQVGIYLDESPISLSLFTPDIDLFDMNRVEVLRGPQGTLFGSGSLSGTVRYITNKPDFDDYEVVAEASGNVIDHGDVGGDIRVAFNVPLSDKVAVRAVGYATRFGGFINAVQPEGRSRRPGPNFRGGLAKDVNSGSRFGGRLAFEFRPTPELTIRPRVIYQNVEVDGFNRVDIFNILANPFTTTRPRVTLGKREQFTQLEEKFTDEFVLADLELEYDFGPVTFKSISSYTDREILQVRDATQLTGSITFQVFGAPEAIFALDAPLFDATAVSMFTEEARISSNDPAARFQWVLGVFYSSIDRRYGQSLDVFGFEDLMSGLLDTDIPTAGPLAPKDVLFFSDIPYNFDQFAVFGEGTYSVTDRLDLTYGFRWYDFTEKRVLNFDGIFADQTIGQRGRTTSSGFSPRVILSFEASDDVELNAQVSKGFRLGGINDPLNVPLCSPQDLVTFGNRPSFKDEELWNYEVGAKSELMGGRATLNIAAFWEQINNLQATLDAGTCSSRIIFNVPDARSIGTEIEFSVQPNENWTLSLSASYTDSELRSTITSTDLAGNTSVVGGIQKGNRLPTVPRFQGAAVVSYEAPMTSEFNGFAVANVQFVGSRFTQIGDQAPGFGTVDLTRIPIGAPDRSTFVFDPKLDSYAIGNFRFGARNDRWEVSMWINNIWDERAKLALDRERGTLARVGFLTNQPRTFGVTVRAQY